MAYICDKTGALFITIVFDGAPLSGKTTSLNSLARSLNKERAIKTPETENDRTLYFDWFEYEGGVYNGQKIRCQLLTVPGQDEFSDRREFILQRADAIILVVDSRIVFTQSNVAHLQSLNTFLSQSSKHITQSDNLNPDDTDLPPKPQIVIQANKQDLDDALSPGEVKEALGLNPDQSILATEAISGRGLRESFALAVRFAIARTQILLESGFNLGTNFEFLNDTEWLEAIKANTQAHSQTKALETLNSGSLAESLECQDGCISATENQNLNNLTFRSHSDSQEITIENNNDRNDYNSDSLLHKDRNEVLSHVDNPSSQNHELHPINLEHCIKIWPSMASPIVDQLTSETPEIFQQRKNTYYTYPSAYLIVCDESANARELNIALSQYKHLIKRYYHGAGVLSTDRCVVLIFDAGDNQNKLLQIYKREPSLEDFLTTLFKLELSRRVADRLYAVLDRCLRQLPALIERLKITNLQLKQISLIDQCVVWNCHLEIATISAQADSSNIFVNFAQQIHSLFCQQHSSLLWPQFCSDLLSLFEQQNDLPEPTYQLIEYLEASRNSDSVISAQ